MADFQGISSLANAYQDELLALAAFQAASLILQFII
jgi:hypothetical protein